MFTQLSNDKFVMVNSEGYLLDGYYIKFTSMPQDGSKGTGVFMADGSTSFEFCFTMNNGTCFGISMTGPAQRFIIKFVLEEGEIDSLRIIFSDRSGWEFVREEDCLESPQIVLDDLAIDMSIEVASF